MPKSPESEKHTIDVIGAAMTDGSAAIGEVEENPPRLGAGPTVDLAKWSDD
jgi:hypothetical protein